MAILRKLLVGILLFCFIMAPVIGESSIILLDKSGSMKGFYDTGALQQIYRKLRDVVAQNERFSQVRLFAFNTQGIETCQDCNSLEPSGDTLIDVAYAQASEQRPGVILLLTDNIQDPGKKMHTDDIRQFYQLLKQEKVEWVFFFPLALASQGPVYGRPNPSGKRAALLYAVLLKKDGEEGESEEREKAFLSLIKEIERSINSKNIRCKPLEQGINVFFNDRISDKKIVRTTSGLEGRFPNFTSTPRARSGMTIRSLYDNIAVAKASIQGKIIRDVRVDGLLKKPEIHQLDVIVTPDRIKDLLPNSDQDYYILEIGLNNLAIDKRLISLLKMPFQKEVKIFGEVEIQIRIPKQELQLTQEILNRFSTDRRDDPDKIYGLQSLVPVLNEGKEVDIRHTIPFNFHLPYPSWSLWALVGLILILFLIPFLLFIWSRKCMTWLLVRVNGEERGKMRVFNILWKSLSNDGLLCRIRMVGEGVAVRPASGFSFSDGEAGTRVYPHEGKVSFHLVSGERKTYEVELQKAIEDTKNKKEEAYHENEELFED